MPSPLRGVLEFEFREVLTEDDNLDLLNHLAFHSWLEGDLAETIRNIQRVLSRRPLNVTALILRGRVRASQGACRDAAADWERAARIIEEQLDATNLPISRLAKDHRRASAANWRDQASRLNCR